MRGSRALAPNGTKSCGTHGDLFLSICPSIRPSARPTQALTGLESALSGLKSALPGLESVRVDFRPERADSRPERADFRLERVDFMPEGQISGLIGPGGRGYGQTNKWMYKILLYCF